MCNISNTSIRIRILNKSRLIVHVQCYKCVSISILNKNRQMKIKYNITHVSIPMMTKTRHLEKYIQHFPFQSLC